MIERRVLIIGIDGGNLATLNPWLESGDMPFLRSLFKRNQPQEILCEIDNALGWATFLTGKLPVHHFAYYWMGRNLRSKQHGLRVDSRFIGNETLWDVLSAAGIKCALISVPFTYPPRPINGCLLSGPGGGLIPGSQMKFSYPETLAHELQAKNITYQIKWSGQRAHLNPVAYVTRINRVTQNHIQAAIMLLDRHQPDCMMIVFRGHDSIQHRACESILSGRLNSRRRLFEAVRGYYRLVDNGMQRIYERIGAQRCQVTTFVVSDHGFGPCVLKVNIDEYFRRHRMLCFRYSSIFNKFTDQFPSLGRFKTGSHSVDMKKTIVYRDSTNSLSLNVGGRDPEGVVSKADFVRIRGEIMDMLREMRHPEVGRIFESIKGSEEFGLDNREYEGYIPDIVFKPREDVYVDGGLDIRAAGKVFCPMRGRVFLNWTGTHRERGIFAAENYRGPTQSRSQTWWETMQPDLTMVAPSVLQAFGLKTPGWMDGEPLP
ncbi:MAG: alkaline phosphatase family protein [Thermodesulfobacteriota bacterium]|nr:alkaline phosphatase family protein [Thermodesulfobacteriota bacterium]